MLFLLFHSQNLENKKYDENVVVVFLELILKTRNEKIFLKTKQAILFLFL